MDSHKSYCVRHRCSNRVIRVELSLLIAPCVLVQYTVLVFSTTLIPPSIHPTDIHSFHHYIILVFTLGVRLPATNRTRIPHDPPA